ncbi:MAG TPA: WD40 repeat domain-containing protein [Pyrinomonadaceae bacterium]|nr:WD40 repeat domain-containing protein [Pyrinomonadaceae bacterium]
MRTADWLVRLRCGIVAVVIIMAAAFECLPQAKVSLKLIQTLSKSELASWTEPFSKEGVLAVRAGDVVQLWDTGTGTLKASLPGHKKFLEAVFTGDGETFITSTNEKPAGLITRLWNVQTGRLKHTLTGLIVHHSTDVIVTLADGDELRFWNAETGELSKTVPAYKGTFSKSIISSDGRRVVRYGGKKGYLWEANTGRLIAELTPPEERNIHIPYYADLKLWGALFSPDSKIIATDDSLNSIELWDADTGRLRALLQGHVSTVYSLAFSPDGRLLASASRDGTAKLWNVETGQLVSTLKAGKEVAREVLFNPEGTKLAVGYHTQARVWDVSAGQLQATLSPHSDINKLVLFGTYWDGLLILLSPQGNLLLTVGNKSVKVWATATGELVATLEGVKWPVAFAPDGKHLVTTGRDGSVLLWAIQ